MEVFHFQDKNLSSVLLDAPLPEIPIVISRAEFDVWKKKIGPRADLHRKAGLVKIQEEDKV